MLTEQVLGLVEKAASSPSATLWLFLWAFAESSFFPIPPDALLVALGVSSPSKAPYFALVTSVASVLGGAFGYGIGLFGGRRILLKLFKRSKVEQVERLYDKYNAWATAIAGLTPLPYKLFTIAGGVFKINFTVFMAASAASRSLRFMAEGLLLALYGETVRDVLVTRLNLISILFVVLLALGFLAVKPIARIIRRGDAGAKVCD